MCYHVFKCLLLIWTTESFGKLAETPQKYKPAHTWFIVQVVCLHAHRYMKPLQESKSERVISWLLGHRETQYII